MPELTPVQQRALRARAHSLHPVVSISQHGLTDAVLAEIERSLKAHELIKVRVYGAGRNDRSAFMADICAKLEAAPVQHIGNILVIFRENAEHAPPAKKAAKPARKAPPAASARPAPQSPRRRLKSG